MPPPAPSPNLVGSPVRPNSRSCWVDFVLGAFPMVALLLYTSVVVWAGPLKFQNSNRRWDYIPRAVTTRAP